MDAHVKLFGWLSSNTRWSKLLEKFTNFPPLNQSIKCACYVFPILWNFSPHKNCTTRQKLPAQHPHVFYRKAGKVTPARQHLHHHRTTHTSCWTFTQHDPPSSLVNFIKWKVQIVWNNNHLRGDVSYKFLVWVVVSQIKWVNFLHGSYRMN